MLLSPWHFLLVAVHFTLALCSEPILVQSDGLHSLPLQLELWVSLDVPAGHELPMSLGCKFTAAADAAALGLELTIAKALSEHLLTVQPPGVELRDEVGFLNVQQAVSLGKGDAPIPRHGLLLTPTQATAVLAASNHSVQQFAGAVSAMVRRVRGKFRAALAVEAAAPAHTLTRYVALGRHTGVPFMNLAHEDSVSSVLRDCGGWEDFQTELLQAFLKPGGVAVDVGAHIGTHTVAFALAVGSTGRVHAFEPQPGVFEVLVANARMSALSNVVVRHAAVGRVDERSPSTLQQLRVPVLDLGSATNVGLAGTNNIGGLSLRGCESRDAQVVRPQAVSLDRILASTGNSPADNEVPVTLAASATGGTGSSTSMQGTSSECLGLGHTWVDVVSLDSFAWAGGDCPTLIKIDVEGMEAGVLDGANATIARCRPVLHVENNVKEASQALISRIHALGYRMVWEVSSYGAEANYYGSGEEGPRSMRQAIELGQVFVSVNLLCLPVEFDPKASGLSVQHQHILAMLTPVDILKPFISQYRPIHIYDFVLDDVLAWEEQSEGSVFVTQATHTNALVAFNARYA